VAVVVVVLVVVVVVDVLVVFPLADFVVAPNTAAGKAPANSATTTIRKRFIPSIEHDLAAGVA
jgi:hypothetical protein